MGAIVGIVIGCVALIGIIIAVSICCCKRSTVVMAAPPQGPMIINTGGAPQLPQQGLAYYGPQGGQQMYAQQQPQQYAQPQQQYAQPQQQYAQPQYK